MPLKTVVKVGNISNLSDARYCSGMGVDMLGFRVIEGQPDYISPKLYQEIRGWISGPKVVAEIYGIASEEELASILQNYQPDYLELGLREYIIVSPSVSLPYILAVTKDEFDTVKNLPGSFAYLMVDEEDADQIKGLNEKTLLKITSGDNLLDNLKKYAANGVALGGSSEIRPGYKEYTGLADILEILDE
jgi:phosphoribosylanthranilate isomerase